MEEVDFIEGGQETEPIMTVKNWVITMLILMIPIINIIMLFVWAFGDGMIKTKSNFAKAQLLIMLILTVLGFLFALLIISLGLFAMPSL